ncbi:hypothetical protein CEXT_96491 [Caerostris extrusa]|uniref:Uncharacterized protein n=1 Tax=Caerostris extrusa TaxID=172846 RepID=A0AAV4T6T9_CAEEX|nr:hypothetical protein CEXT_96491 [Caerostris extrusa]
MLFQKWKRVDVERSVFRQNPLRFWSALDGNDNFHLDACQCGNGVDVERSFPPRTHFVFRVLWMEMTTSTWMLVSGELCATSGKEFVLAFPPDQVHALKRESNG